MEPHGDRQAVEGVLVNNPLKDVFKEPSGDLPFLQAVREIEKAGLGTPIYGANEEKPFGIIVLNEDFKIDDHLRNGRVLIVLSQGIALLGHKPAEPYRYTLGQIEIMEKRGNEEQKFIARKAREQFNDPDYQYDLKQPSTFVDRLASLVKKTKQGGHISTEDFLELVSGEKHRSIFRRKNAIELTVLRRDLEDPKKIISSLINNKSLSVIDLYTEDHGIKNEMKETGEKIGYRTRLGPAGIVEWLGERIMYKTKKKAPLVTDTGIGEFPGLSNPEFRDALDEVTAKALDRNENLGRRHQWVTTKDGEQKEIPLITGAPPPEKARMS
jgi:hypothetical protein